MPSTLVHQTSGPVGQPVYMYMYKLINLTLQWNFSIVSTLESAMINFKDGYCCMYNVIHDRSTCIVVYYVHEHVP